jgi:hypothetical protein
MTDVTIRIQDIDPWPWEPEGKVRWSAELMWEGLTFAVPCADGAWPSYYDALKGADEYRKTWTPPSAETLADLERRANEPSTPNVSMRMGGWER